MNYRKYKEQVELLLDILPFIGKESCFALHGGTAINFFRNDMQRLSVDIDLTYIPIEDRETSIKSIQKALLNCKKRIETSLPNTQVIFKSDLAKFYVNNKNASIKVEVNLIKRGCFNPP